MAELALSFCFSFSLSKKEFLAIVYMDFSDTFILMIFMFEIHWLMLTFTYTPVALLLLSEFDHFI